MKSLYCIAGTCVIWVGYWYYGSNKTFVARTPSSVQMEELDTRVLEKSRSPQTQAPSPGVLGELELQQASSETVQKNLPQQYSTFPQKTLSKGSGEVSYTVEEGLAVVDGDIVLGEPTSSAASGTASIDEVHLWPGGIVPFHVQEDAPNKEEIFKALANFHETGIQFVAYNGQEDVLVFEAGQGCRSYLGKVGGKQPLWISSGCRAKEITHEIMHALGFIHEQNRTDRDSHVQVVWENVIEKHRHNFEVFPASLMKVSGNSTFDYHSIMLYEPTAFAKQSGNVTLKSLHPELEIDPNPHLSAGDRVRLKRVYASE